MSELANRVRSGDRASLGRAITLVESRRAEDRVAAEELLHTLLPHTGGAHRVGITGVPGVGKSTFIETLGTLLADGNLSTEATQLDLGEQTTDGEGLKVAVLAVDPSSSRTGGSILGDKTRMQKLAVNPRAFIRPSPASGTLGGVTRRTRESMLVCEAAGFDVILVETVGAGQSETAVADMVDFFLVLMLPGAGDDLQGIKKGVLEIADMIAVNKADGDNLGRAQAAAADYRSALRILQNGTESWSTPVVQCSGLTGAGLDELWSKVLEHKISLLRTGEFQQRRSQQLLKWFEESLEEAVLARFWEHDPAAALLSEVREKVMQAEVLPPKAVRELLGAP